MASPPSACPVRGQSGVMSGSGFESCSYGVPGESVRAKSR